jgi:hypothetical protein
MNKEVTPSYALPVLLVLSLIPWFSIQLHQSLNTDLAWLTIAAGRLLDGAKMADAYYDPNPPLSVLVQLIPAFISRAFSIPVYYATFFYSITLVCLSSWTVWLILRVSQQFKPAEIQILMVAYILANTVLTGQYLGERDHYIVLALFPFVLIQAGLTYGFQLPHRIKWPVLALGAIMILLKPHYGLIPVLILLHRMIRQRRWLIFKDPDFIALTVATFLYALTLVLFFPDFLKIILPDSLSFYVANRAPWVMQIALPLMAFLALLSFAAGLMPGDRNYIPACLFGLAALCVIPFAMQGKGFFYHIIPTIIFFFCGFALMVFQIAEVATARFSLKIVPALPPMLTALLIGLSYYALPPNRFYPTHEDYMKLSLPKLVTDCGTPCPFFLFNDMMETIHPMDIYTGQIHASRFSSYWFLPALIKADFALHHNQPATMTAEQVAAGKKKYAAMVGEDFKTYNPRLVIIGQFHIVSDGLKPFDFVSYFSADPEFAREWKHYKFIKTITVDRSAYFGGTVMAQKKDDIEFKIYKKNDWPGAN